MRKEFATDDRQEGMRALVDAIGRLHDLHAPCEGRYCRKASDRVVRSGGTFHTFCTEHAEQFHQDQRIEAQRSAVAAMRRKK